MTDEAGLVRLLHQADWTRLSMPAEVSDGSRVLIAPGKRYRYQTAGYLTGCNGGRPWELSDDDDDTGDGEVHWISGPEPPLPRLLCPSWLLESSRLEVRGRVRACGRDALDVVMTRRPGIRGVAICADDPSGPAEVLVDAASGILLRVAGLAGAEPELTELASADFDPVIDPAQFMPPPGSRIAEGLGESLAALGPAWGAARTAAGLAAGALGAWIRYSPFRDRPHPAAGGTDPGAAIPRDEPAPELSPEGVPSGPSGTDLVLHLLHAGGPDAFTATLHQRTDLGAMASRVPAGARRAGFGGLGLLMDAVSDQPAASHLTSGIRIAGPLRYQIDRDVPGRSRGPGCRTGNHPAPDLLHRQQASTALRVPGHYRRRRRLPRRHPGRPAGHRRSPAPRPPQTRPQLNPRPC